MCGIAGFVHFDAARAADPDRVRRMTETLVHRGPDGQGVVCDGSAALGHRRLAIIDQRSGEQPMFGPDRRHALVCDGEIYNHVELRDDLRSKGHRFETDSDTEVILAAYREWDLECVQRFNGMWAFALWDSARRRLFLSRDRLGGKPLFYALHDRSLFFGSEIKALAAAGVPLEPDPRMLGLYLTFGYVPAPHSFFKSVHKLRPGHNLIVTDGHVQDRCYWDVPAIRESDMRMDRLTVEKEFSQLLSDSVRLRMRSDALCGAFLSGGLDSACIVGLMATQSDSGIDTFTIGFDHPEYDERARARVVAEAFRTRHHEMVVLPDSFDESLARVCRHFDEPFGDSSAIPTGHVSRFASAHVKVALTGDGGDEVLSGYPAYQSERVVPVIRALPNTLLRWVSRQFTRRGRGGAGRFFQRVGRVIETARLSIAERIVRKANWLQAEDLRRLIPEADVLSSEDYLTDFFEHRRYGDDFYNLMLFDLKISLPDDSLTKVDRMSMAFSLETRAPFLDHRLVELMAGVSKRVKTRGMERKSVLRATAARRLPRAILRGPKQGFAVPLREWFKDRAFETVALESLSRLSTLGFDPRVIAELMDRNNRGGVDLGNFLWKLLVLERTCGGAAAAARQ